MSVASTSNVHPIIVLVQICRCHPKDITSVAYHRSYPLFASCSDDCTAYIFHGMVYSDLNQNPLIVPLEILRGHSNFDGRGNFLLSSPVHVACKIQRNNLCACVLQELWIVSSIQGNLGCSPLVRIP